MARTRYQVGFGNYAEYNSFITGYHVYKKSWTPTFGEKLEAVIQIDNAADKYAVSIKKREQIVGHVERGITGKFAQTIFFFLRADKTARCIATVTGEPLNEGDKLGQKIPCRLHLTGKKDYLRILKDNLN